MSSSTKAGSAVNGASLETLSCVVLVFKLLSPAGINPLDGVVIMASTNREDVLDQVKHITYMCVL